MRILHLIATLDPCAGGPSNSIRRILAAYPSTGDQGDVLTLDAPDSACLIDLDCDIHALGPVSTKYGYTPRLIPWLRKNRDRYDGFVVHGLWQYLGLAVRLAVYPFKPYLVFTHGMLDPYFKRAHPLKHLKKIPYWLLNEYWLLRRANHVLFTSSAEAQLATQTFWPSRWTPRIVPYGASRPHGDPALLTRTFLDSCPDLCTPDGTARRFLLFLGRIHSKKGCDLLLEAFARVAERSPELHLVFAGPAGPSRTALAPSFLGKLRSRAAANGISHRVHWTGMLEGDLKWGALYACEAFCLPSHQENFGIAVAEALACARPVLISDKVNIWQEIVADGAALCAPDTCAGTLRTLERWLDLSQTGKAAMSVCALDCFKARYDLQATAGSIVEAFSLPTRTESNSSSRFSKRKSHVH